MTVLYDDPVLYDSPDVVYNGYEAVDGMPVTTVEIALIDDPGTPVPSWTDVTPWVEKVHTVRGRQHELDRVEAGTATIVLDNNDQRFDPANGAGPYAGTLLPMRRIRISATWNGVRYGIFSGFVEAWPQQYAGAAALDAFVTLQCVDLFKVLNLLGLDVTYGQELTGARISRVLDDIGWPSADRDIGPGQTTVQNVTLEGASAREHLQRVAETENGLFFIDRDGRPRFIDRHQLILAGFDTSTLTWGDEDGENPYDGIVVDYSDATIWNDFRVSSQGVLTATAEDAGSQQRFFRRTLVRDAQLFVSTNEQDDAAHWLLSRFKNPALRVSSLGLSGLADPALWPRVLGRELGDKVRVRRDPPGDGDVIEQDSFVEGIEHLFSALQWQTLWRLSPITGFSDYWILGDPQQGVLGSTTRLAY